MFFKKSLLKKSATLKTLTITSFAGGLNSVTDDAYLGSSVAKISYNVTGESGVLKENKGVVAFQKKRDGKYSPLTLDDKKIKRVWYFRRFSNL